MSEVTADRDLGEEVLAEEARLDELERRRDESRRRLDELRAARNDAGETRLAEVETSSDS